MNGDQIVEIIKSVGFPIAAYLLMYFDMRKILLEIRDEVKILNGR